MDVAGNRTVPYLTVPNQTEPKDTKVKTICATDEGFDHFWTVYPKKTAKQEALKSWKKLKLSEELMQ